MKEKLEPIDFLVYAGYFIAAAWTIFVLYIAVRFCRSHLVKEKDMKPRLIKALHPLNHNPNLHTGPQKVHLGRTVTGTPGLFTGMYLAVSISNWDYFKCIADQFYYHDLAKKYHFEVDITKPLPCYSKEYLEQQLR